LDLVVRLSGPIHGPCPFSLLSVRTDGVPCPFFFQKKQREKPDAAYQISKLQEALDISVL
ncbi:MAG: hypothetical protein N2578_03275, partial [Bdellovibrionaceae bacterium]|nr:hypothetical protein [Pseudobdellovibrionaceae bacterium]